MTGDLSENFPVQNITVFFPPLFLMSRGYSPYRAKDIIPFKGYLSSFEPVGVNESGNLEVSLGFTLKEDVK